MNMIFNKTEKQERDYLRKIVGIIQSAISDADDSVRERVRTLDQEKHYLWENRDIDPHEIKTVRENILNVYAIGEKVIAKRSQLGKMLDIPYFGRIDFREGEGESGVLPVYIGIHTFFDFGTNSNLIYDWRAPVSAMYYDYELGPASYEAPSGRLTGEIVLKRQYRIRRGEMEYMLESSVTVHDDILQKELSSNSDDRMKNIVATIQREQNTIIRNEDAPVLIIQGVAGSGKTSIALHRVAYLLYAHRGTLSSKDILIVSPNKVFADYISNVLPELGEETIPETSMEELLSQVLEGKYRYQTFFGQVSEILEKPSPAFIERIRFKSSPEFVRLLEEFILHIENTGFRAEDFRVKHITIPREFIAEQFRRFHRYPMRRRFEVMTDYIAGELEVKYRVFLTTAERNTLKKAIREMFTGNNDMEVYKQFFEWAARPEMFRMRSRRTLEYSDLAPLAYLRIVLEGLQPYGKVRHLLVDEMQDYSPIQYRVLQRLFPCRKTILGDAGQSVNPYGSSDAAMIRSAMSSGEIVRLNKSYRSTAEITAFAQRIRPDKDIIPVARHGAEPQKIRYKDARQEAEGIAGMIAALRDSGFSSLGIICKTESQAQVLYDELKAVDREIYFLSSQSEAYMKGIVITSAHMAKGLEFDQVIIPQADSRNYSTDIDRSMLYVAATRAMHRLTLTYSGKFTTLVR